jgi:hypothetical protein
MQTLVKDKKVNIAVSNLKCQAQFISFSLTIMRYSKFSGRILEPFEFWKIWTNNAKSMAKNKKVRIAVTYFKYPAQ